MARQALDTTNVYRFKVTHSGISELTVYRRTEGQPFEDVEFIGPYTRKIPWNGWVPSYGTLKVERQQLSAQYDDSIDEAFMMWITIETKHYEDGEPVL